MEPHARPLKAPWTGAWRAPWALGKGRRFGDLAWALAAVGIAWMQGGERGRWPLQDWEASPWGPRPTAPPARWRERPDPAWVALLRHGSPSVPADRPGSREELLEEMAWEALLRGEGGPFLQLGLLHLDLELRARWVAVLGATDEEGRLHLPPFLAPLVPEPLRPLPPGWWDTLLGAMDAEGLLLPSGPPPPQLARIPLEGLHPLTVPAPPPGLPPEALAACGGAGWMIDPRLRAWSRGPGASPRALLALQPPTLGLGAPPDPSVRALLDFQIPPDLPEAWTRCLEADLREAPFLPPPPTLGHPTWDALRVRWGGDPPDPAPGYPGLDDPAGGSCDPFHLMGMGWQCFHRQRVFEALTRFAFSHARFKQLGAEGWARRAAHNAAGVSYFWGDLPRSKAFRKLAGTPGPPFDALQEIHDLILMGEFGRALAQAKALEDHPKVGPQARALRVHGLINLGDWEALASLRPEELPADLADLVRAIQTRNFDSVPPALDGEGRLLWEAVRARLTDFDAEGFWDSWERCPNALMRLGCGLHVLEAHPSARLPARLLQLQELAHRCGSEALRARLSRLWPSPPLAPALEPGDRVLAQLASHPGPAWVVWGEAWEHRLGSGDAPPPVLEDLLTAGTEVEPFPAGAWVWWGRLLVWERAPVGWIVLGFEPHRPMEPPSWVDLLAPWVAGLRADAPELPFVEGQALLTNGSEPMAGFLRELDQVAPSRLPVLIEGPSGAGKELAARELHLRSGRKGPLVAVNCSEFAPGVLESELFGHVKGAFTGAARDKVGAIESARQGTLFLDEVADLEPRLQSMLLRVLQEREIRRVGSDRPVQVDVRFVAATHRDLDLLVAQGHFRKDLLFRLQGARLRLPSLDERRHEFGWLLPRLVAQICREEQLPLPALAPGVAQALARRRWPGNFRELRHVLQRALLRARGGTLSVGHFPELAEPAPAAKGWEEATREFQRKLLLDTLRAHGFQVADAARALGLARPALYAAAKRLGLDVLAERHKQR